MRAHHWVLLSVIGVTYGLSAFLYASVATRAQEVPAPAFSRDLRLGSRGEDVRTLQRFLNAHGVPVAHTGAGSPSQETDVFGPRTQRALMLFQELHANEILRPFGWTRATGVFLRTTRAFLNRLVEIETQTSVPSAPNTESPAQPTSQEPPSTPQQQRTVTTGAGYFVGGMAAGVPPEALILENGADTVTVRPNESGRFVFPIPLKDGEPYNIHVKHAPPGWTCFVSPTGTGIVLKHDVDDIRVLCASAAAANKNPFSSGGQSPAVRCAVGGSVTGLSGTLVLENQWNGDVKSLTANGAFTFPTTLVQGSQFIAAVTSQPGSPAQYCAITNGNGTLSCSSPNPISIVCTTLIAPTITFDDIEKNLDEGSFVPSITTNSPGAVTFSTTNTYATVTGSTVTLLSAGVETLSYSQAATNVYAAASGSATLSIISNQGCYEYPGALLCNNHTCVTDTNGGHCVCGPSYEGAYCQNVAACAGLCQNGGTCISGSTCSCTDGYTGDYCQNSSSSSDANCAGQCQNGGTCVPDISGGMCSCTPDYYGTYCETPYLSDINCAGQCQNNGFCNATLGGGECSCDYCFYGTYCENYNTELCP